MGKRAYDVAAYVWPAYTGDELRARIFWNEGIGEWQSVRSAEAKFPGHAWPRRPLWGYVNEADSETMRMEIDAAADHGVNVFIYDWYWYDGRPFLEQCLNQGFLGAPNKDRMQFYLMWANHDAVGLWNKALSDGPAGDTPIWRGTVGPEEFRRITRHWIDRYLCLPNYYRIADKPVVMIYDVANLIKGLGGIAAARRALDTFRADAATAGLPGIHLQLAAWWPVEDLSGVDKNHTGSCEESLTLLGFDSITHYQFVHFTDINRPYPDVLTDVSREWERLDRECAVPYFPHISLGWDNNPRFYGLRPGIMQDTTPENIRRGLEMAKAYLDAHPTLPPLVTVNSWNEWTEGSYLEPDDRNGYGYLEAVRAVFG